MTEKTPAAIISCSVFRPELEKLQTSGDLDMHVYYLDSELHMHPERLHGYMRKLVARLRGKGTQVVLLYGDCHAHMPELCDPETVVRTKGINCCEILMGSERYRSEHKSRPFYLLPEWTLRPE